MEFTLLLKPIFWEVALCQNVGSISQRFAPQRCSNITRRGTILHESVCESTADHPYHSPSVGFSPGDITIS